MLFSVVVLKLSVTCSIVTLVKEINSMWPRFFDSLFVTGLLKELLMNFSEIFGKLLNKKQLIRF